MIQSTYICFLVSWILPNLGYFMDVSARFPLTVIYKRACATTVQVLCFCKTGHVIKKGEDDDEDDRIKTGIKLRPMSLKMKNFT